MRICPSCGRENPDEADFCECGEYLRWEPTNVVRAVAHRRRRGLSPIATRRSTGRFARPRRGGHAPDRRRDGRPERHTRARRRRGERAAAAGTRGAHAAPARWRRRVERAHRGRGRTGRSGHDPRADPQPVRRGRQLRPQRSRAARGLVDGDPGHRVPRSLRDERDLRAGGRDPPASAARARGAGAGVAVRGCGSVARARRPGRHRAGERRDPPVLRDRHRATSGAPIRAAQGALHADGPQPRQRPHGGRRGRRGHRRRVPVPVRASRASRSSRETRSSARSRACRHARCGWAGRSSGASTSSPRRSGPPARASAAAARRGVPAEAVAAVVAGASWRRSRSRWPSCSSRSCPSRPRFRT